MIERRPTDQDVALAFRGYVTGFVLSLVLTITAYLLVMRHLSTQHQVPSDNALLYLLATLAILQLVVQVFYFLHLGEEKRPRWNLKAFLFMSMVVVLLVGGSLWIMKHLDYHGRTPQQTDQHIIEDEGFEHGHHNE